MHTAAPWSKARGFYFVRWSELTIIKAWAIFLLSQPGLKTVYVESLHVPKPGERYYNYRGTPERRPANMQSARRSLEQLT